MKTELERLSAKRGSSFSHISQQLIANSTNIGCGRFWKVDYLSTTGKWIHLAKFLLLIFVPIIGGWSFTLYSLVANVKEQAELSDAQQTMMRGVYLGRLINTIQKERDLSILYISRLGPGTKRFLLSGYDETDQAFTDMWVWPEEFAAHPVPEFRSKKKLVSYINLHRAQLDPDTSLVFDEIVFYGDIVEFMIDWMLKNIKESGFGTIWKSLVVFQKIVRCLLDSGAERAYGAVFFAQGNFPDTSYFDYYFNRIHRFNYNYRVSTYYSNLVDPFFEVSETQSSITTSVRAFREVIKYSNMSGQYLSLDKAQLYYDNITLRVEYIYGVQESVAARINYSINETLSSVFMNIIVYAVTSAVVILACPVIMYFSESLTSNIQNYSKVLAKASNELNKEKDKTDNLLYQMLPKTVADRLKMNSKVDSEFFKSATIMFSSLVSFTQMTIELNPLEVVDLLNRLYTAIDSKIDKYDVYKVETINDTYMVVSGVPLPNGNRHASEIGYLSLEIVDLMKRNFFKVGTNKALQLQIGVCTGSVSAGIVGNVMLRYCLFGDTVNIASRMKSYSQPNKIHVSESTYRVLKKNGSFTMQTRGSINVKGKGEMNTYWLLEAVQSRPGGGNSWKLPGETGSYDEDSVSLQSKKSSNERTQFYQRAVNKSVAGPSYIKKDSITQSNRSKALESLKSVEEDTWLY